MKNRDDFQDDGRVVADMSDLNDAGGLSFRKFKNKDVKTDTSSDFSEEDRRIYIKTALISSMKLYVDAQNSTVKKRQSAPIF